MKSQEKAPIANSYWVRPGELLAGEYPGGRSRKETQAKIRRLLAAGVTYFLDLTEPGELRSYAATLYNEARAMGVAVKHRRILAVEVG